MHIAKFIKEQEHRNPPPRHWWQRKSPWYERAFMIVLAIFGAGMAIYLPVSYVTMPAEIRDPAGPLGVAVVVIFTLIGLSMVKLGIWGIVHTFSRTRSPAMEMSHGEAILLGIVITALAIPFWGVVRGEFDKGFQLTAETQVLQAKIKALEASR